MCEFSYDYIKNKYCNNSGLLFINTNSLMFEFKIEDIYEDFSKDKQNFDFRNIYLYQNVLMPQTN